MRFLFKKRMRPLKSRDVDKLLELEQLCGAMKLAKESRDASVNLGRQFIRTVSPLGTDEFLAEWKERIDAKSIKGHYAILYGIYSATTGVSVHHAVMMYLYASRKRTRYKTQSVQFRSAKYRCSSDE